MVWSCQFLIHCKVDITRSSSSCAAVSPSCRVCQFSGYSLVHSQYIPLVIWRISCNKHEWNALDDMMLTLLCLGPTGLRSRVSCPCSMFQAVRDRRFQQDFERSVFTFDVSVLCFSARFSYYKRRCSRTALLL